MNKHRVRRIVFLGTVICFWLAISACSCGQPLSKLLQPAETIPTIAPTATLGILQEESTAPRKSQTQPTNTPLPLSTKQPVPVAPTATTTIEEILPKDLSRPVDIEVTESQLNDYLAEQTFSAEGAEVENVRATITGENILVAFEAQYAPLDLNAGVTVKGVPVVVDGQVYIEIQNVELDSSVPAFTRALAKVAIEQALAQYGTEKGIPVPVDRLEVDDVSLEPGKIIISGVTLSD